MVENLEFQYDQVISYIKGYYKYLLKIFMHLIFLTIRSPFKSYLMLGKILSKIFDVDFLSGKNPVAIRTIVEYCATQDERASEYFKLAISDYPIDSLSDALRVKFSTLDFDKIKKLHDLKSTRLSEFRLMQVPALVLAAAALVLKSIPKKVVEENFGLKYEDFEVRVFWLMLTLLGYVLIVILPTWYSIIRARQTHSQVRIILEYTAIKNK